MSKCKTVEQGYPTLRTMHDCGLSHTGQSLLYIAILAGMFVAMGLVLLYVGRRS